MIGVLGQSGAVAADDTACIARLSETGSRIELLFTHSFQTHIAHEVNYWSDWSLSRDVSLGRFSV